MTTTMNIESSVREEIAAVAAGAGCELVSADFAGGVLRVVIDREEGGVGIEDCANVSRQVSALLDVLDFGPTRYTLEVSSPGLDRPLNGPREYERFIGRLARITYATEPESEAKRTIVARLAAFDDRGGGIVTVTDPRTDEALEIPLDRIARARLEIELT